MTEPHNTMIESGNIALRHGGDRRRASRCRGACVGNSRHAPCATIHLLYEEPFFLAARKSGGTP